MPKQDVTFDITREWVEFPDPAYPEHERWIRLDVTWLLSRWNCIFGKGCPGTHSVGWMGCCGDGAYFDQGKDDKANTLKHAAELTREDWQNYDLGHRGKRLNVTERGELDGDGPQDWKTRVIDKGEPTQRCIFANDADHPGGAGCALHQYALRTGQSFTETKPHVCWILPTLIRREHEELPDGQERQTIIVTEHTRREWGEGGHGLDWYCSSNPEAHTASKPVYKQLADELTKELGEVTYARIVNECAKREKTLVATHEATRKSGVLQIGGRRKK